MKASWLRLLVIFITFPILAFSQHTIKFASIAPEGSTWLNVMKEYDQAVSTATNGKVRFKIYAGGVMGDDKAVLRKIRLGQLHSAGFTGVGLGEIASEVRILDSPFLFRNYAEVDFILDKFYGKFADAFEQKGYVLLGWAEVGFVYVFSQKPIRSKADMEGVKMWMWEGDPVADATFKALEIAARPLSVVEVMTALQTGMIDGFYISPLAAIAMQWFTKANYMMELPLADACGAVVLSKEQFNTLPADFQQILLNEGRTYFKKLMKLSRDDNAKAIETLKQNGIQLIPAPAASVQKEFEEDGRKARRALTGTLYSQELLTEVENALGEYRKKAAVK
ncbi:TRAP transporter substrate-binding protein DctP [candidate division KSB1 bacterium]|nr:TRAP transporter substrate-binding protein DctP [candidate division KSB1 bacterium]